MSFNPRHWKRPRQTIATKFQNNDLGYATHGAITAVEAIKYFNLLPSSLSKLTLLDYGCGTGRIGRILEPLFKAVYCFDPTPECIIEGKNEIARSGINFNKLTITCVLNEVPECDLAISVNVMEHLNVGAQKVLISNLITKVRGTTLLWYRPKTNHQVLADFLTDEQMQEDMDPEIGIQVRAFNFRKQLNM